MAYFCINLRAPLSQKNENEVELPRNARFLTGCYMYQAYAIKNNVLSNYYPNDVSRENVLTKTQFSFSLLYKTYVKRISVLIKGKTNKNLVSF